MPRSEGLMGDPMGDELAALRSQVEDYAAGGEEGFVRVSVATIRALISVWDLEHDGGEDDDEEETDND